MIKITHFFKAEGGVYDLRHAAVFHAQISFFIVWLAGLFIANLDSQPGAAVAVSMLFFALQICVFLVAFFRNWAGLVALSAAGLSAALIQIIRAAG